VDSLTVGNLDSN